MKKILIIMFLFGLAFTGCTDNKNDTDKNKSDSKNKSQSNSKITFEMQRAMSIKMIDAIESNDFKAIDKLLSEGAIIDFQESIGGTSLLIHAIFYNYIESAKYLISKGANVNLPTNKGISPLMNAIQDKDLGLVSLLVDKGADVNAKDDDGRSPLYFAIYMETTEIVKYLIKNKADVNVTFTLRKNLGDENDKGVKKTLLQFAKDEGNKEIIDIIIKAGAK